MVFSCYGRWHADSTTILERMTLQAARRLGIADHRPLLRRATAAVGVAIWRRVVAMARASLPRLSADGVRLLHADADVDFAVAA